MPLASNHYLQSFAAPNRIWNGATKMVIAQVDAFQITQLKEGRWQVPFKVVGFQVQFLQVDAIADVSLKNTTVRPTMDCGEGGTCIPGIKPHKLFSRKSNFAMLVPSACTPCQL